MGTFTLAAGCARRAVASLREGGSLRCRQLTPCRFRPPGDGEFHLLRAGGRVKGAYASPLTIPASGRLRATLRAVPSSLTRPDGPAGLAVLARPSLFAASLPLALASVLSSARRMPPAPHRLPLSFFSYINPRLKLRCLKAQSSKLKTQNSKLKTQNSKPKAQSSKLSS